MRLKVLLVSAFAGLNLYAQEGDQPGESQAPVIPRERIPPAPALTPEEALKSFRLPPGFQIELVASEPLVHEPIQIVFDPDGRIWVVEMRGYMPGLDGTGEFDRVGSVAVLEDGDGDGRMDRRKVFLDGLVMPRALALVRGGVLIAEPPKLWFARDTDGDGKCDEKIEVAGDYATEADPKHGAKANIEHSANGLLLAIDNWIYNANHTVRFRQMDGQWRREVTDFRGQWGITQDDFGRLFYNSNEDPLRADLVPSAYLSRNPNYRGAAGGNVKLYTDKVVWPARMNPGVNRGYRSGQLRADGTLATFTAACAPLVYRGDQFPVDCHGNVFVCEPAGNLVRRYALDGHGLEFTARNAHDRREFLTSTDERFRPIFLSNSPDGGLYIADLCRGIIQHRIYVTPYLRRQILDRGLDRPTGYGRIYRVVREGARAGQKPALSGAAPVELIQHLSHPNGWWRDTAQRLLVERNDAGAVASLKQVVAAGTTPLGRLHALWVLEGMRQLDAATIKAGLADSHPQVRAATIRIAEPLLGSVAELLRALLNLVTDPAPEVRVQLALTLGEVRDRRAETAMVALVLRHADELHLRDAIVTGLGGRELEFLEGLLARPEWQEQKPGRVQLSGALAQCIFSRAKPDSVGRLLELIASRPDGCTWQQVAMLDGVLSTVPASIPGKAAPRTKTVRLNAESAALVSLSRSGVSEISARAARIAALLVWPGKPGADADGAVKALTPEQQKRFEYGKELYSISCAACHQPHGNGQDGLAPPLADSDWVEGSPQRLIRIVLHGVRGPIQVKGRTYELDMPALGVFEDEQIAAVLTYIRREWGHTFDPVEPELVKSVRAETEKREEAWTDTELLKIP